MKGIFRQYLSLIDFINYWIGKCFAVMIPIIVVITVYEVIARYFFSAPTIWAWDINMQLLALTVFWGGGFVLKENKHISVDILYQHFSPKHKAIADLLTSPIFFFFTTILLWQMGKMAMESLNGRETMPSVFAPPIYPLKIMITIGVLLMILQAIAKLIRDVQTVFGKGQKNQEEQDAM